MINLSIKLESPELMAAFLALAEALQQRNLGTALLANDGQTIEIRREEAKTVTIEQVKAKLYNLSQAGKAAQVKKLLSKFNATKLSEVVAENYAALLQEADAI
jgi:hypothetical protein